jgi:hypothetical protein
LTLGGAEGVFGARGDRRLPKKRRVFGRFAEGDFEAEGVCEDAGGDAGLDDGTLSGDETARAGGDVESGDAAAQGAEPAVVLEREAVGGAHVGGYRTLVIVGAGKFGVRSNDSGDEDGRSKVDDSVRLGIEVGGQRGPYLHDAAVCDGDGYGFKDFAGTGIGTGGNEPCSGSAW